MNITRGITFGAQCTAAGLHQLVDSATFSNADFPDFSNTEKPIYVTSGNPVSPIVGQLCYDNTVNGSTNPWGVLLYWDGAKLLPAASAVYVKNISGTTIAVGDVIRAGTYDATGGWITCTKTTTAGHTGVLGIVATAMADQATGFCVTRGVCVANLNASAVIGGAMKTSTTSGFCDATSRSVTTGCFGRVLDITNSICLLTGVLRAT